MNGLRNGKGTEYFKNGEIKFEGEYLKGRIWNGKEYDYYINGEMQFEVEYLNGKILNRKEYARDGELRFEGACRNACGPGPLWYH